MNSIVKNNASNAVAVWILTGIVMLIIQVILGGITRLTGSGLSITEWDIITGTLPPLNQHQWLEQFHHYQQTPQYRLLNADFNLSDFKSIFFWEWFHRFWGRLIAVAFAVPFVIFLIRRKFKSEMVRPLLILFLLGALQGAVGWIMVASGLTGDAIYVKPAKLALHFLLACILIGYAFWFGLQLIISKESRIKSANLKYFTWIILIVLMFQLIAGALMAGYKAAPAAPTWPDINGYFIPPNLHGPNGNQGILENLIGIHFIHRSLAYLIFILVISWTIAALRSKNSAVFSRIRLLPILMASIQLMLGIATVLSSNRIRVARWNEFEWMAICHQLVAIFLFLSLVAALFITSGKKVINRPAALEPTPIK
jgi:cytochrome c oxidase assembly protein subunit 15